MDSKQWDFIDILSILSFVIGLQNLELNIDQNDMDRQTKDINEKADELVSKALSEIHDHLQTQDEKINQILELMKE